MSAPARRHALPPLLAGALWLVTLAGLVVCLLLTIPRCLDPGAPRLIELASLAPLGIPFAAVVVAGAATLWVSRASPGRRTAKWTVLAGASLLALHLGWLAPLYGGSSPRSASGSQFVVIAQNLEYGDASWLAREAARERADAVILSDVPPSQLAAVLDTDMARRFPFHVGTGPNDPGTIVFSRHPLHDNTPISAGGASRLVHVDLPGFGPVDLVAAHPPPPYQGDGWMHEFAQLRSFLTKRYDVGHTAPLVVAGDFNASADNAPFRRILSLGLRDAVAQVNGGYQPTWPASGSRRLLGLPLPPLIQIDHVLVSKALNATRTSTFQVPGSDHRGVLVHIRLI